ncbi:MAG: class I SAM-dependent methyltransferase [Usitatibacter sp.]
MSERFFRALAKDAAARYPSSDRFARHFAYGKLTGDPAFRRILADGMLPPRVRLLDLGCGQGVLASLLAAARERHHRGEWPGDWAPPPDAEAIRGIDLVEKDLARARRANPVGALFVQGDIRDAQFGPANAVVILDVLHYIDFDAQREVLRRVRASLEHGGVLLLRVGDASDSLRFRITVAVDRIVMRARGHRLPRLWCRPLGEWIRELEALGFAAEPIPMSAGTPFANVLLRARYDGSAAVRAAGS